MKKPFHLNIKMELNIILVQSLSGNLLVYTSTSTVSKLEGDDFRALRY